MHAAPRATAAFVVCLTALPVLAQAGEAEYRLSLRTAERLAATDGAKATEELRRLVGQLEADRALPAARREQLLRVANDRLRVLALPIPAELPTPQPKVQLSAEAARKAEEWAKVKAGLDAATALAKQGRPNEAKQHLQSLARYYQDNLTVAVMSGIATTTERRDAEAKTRSDKEKSVAAGLNSIDRAAVSPREDVEYPKDFKERTAKRLADTKPTADELKMLKALETPVSSTFNNSKLQDAVDTLATLMGYPVMIEPAAIDDLKIGYDAPITFAPKRPVQARTALKSVLGQVGLTYVVREGTVIATTPERARAYLVTKAYYLGDLVQPIGFLDGGFEGLNVLMLIDTIVNGIDPQSWEQNGGIGTIRYYAPTKSLIVRQSAEVHARMKSR